MIETILVVLISLPLGLALGFALRGREVENWRSFVNRLEKAQADEHARWQASLEGAAEAARGERERLVRELLAMKKDGFHPVLPEEEGGEGWVMDDDYEVEVQERRQNGGMTDSEATEVRGEILSDLRPRAPGS